MLKKICDRLDNSILFKFLVVVAVDALLLAAIWYYPAY